MAAAVPLIAAGIGAASTIYSSNQQSDQAKKQRRMQQDALDKQGALQQKQERLALEDKNKLQEEESNELRSRRSRGRRSLLAGDEQGVDMLGQRVGAF